MALGRSSQVEEFVEETRAQLDQTRSDLKEVTNMLNQSKAEVDKLAQRNATIAAQLRHVQTNLETLPRADIKAAYDAAQESQQRLFAMRGQLEKLQSDQVNLEKLADHLQRMVETLESLGGAPRPGNGGVDGTPIVVRVVEAQEAERQRLSRQIHDGPAQALSNFILQSEIAMRLFEVDPERAKAELASLKSAATATFQKVRDFIMDLRPMMLDDLGLVPTVKRYVDTFREKTGIQTTLTVTGPTDHRLESVREVMIFRGMQELLTNVRNHAQATQVRITFDTDDMRVRVLVEDNGRGFDVEAALSGQQKTIGLSTLKERIGLLGGQLHIESEPGQGTQVVIDVPVGGFQNQ
jgi:two-component system sensor histidine kinase DegS